MADRSPARVIKTVKFPTDAEAQQAFEAYVSAVGRVAHAWNYLHEKLGRLFVCIVKAQNPNVTAAVWYSTYSDRSQRQMLETAIKTSDESEWRHLVPNARDDLYCLLKRANNLGTKRDDAIHAPCSLITDVDRTEMATSFLSGHRRAKNLVGKALLVEFDWTERCAESLSRFVDAAENSLTFGGTWPNIPPVPDRKPRRAVQGRVPPRQIPK